jgi:hypothetical protein
MAPLSTSLRKRTAFIAACVTFCTSAAQSDTLSFAAVRDSSLPLNEYLTQSYTYTTSQVRSDGLLVSVGTTSGAAAAQTAPGVNRVAVESLVAVDDERLRQESIGGPFSVSVSAWTDRFTINGGVGRGTALVSASITGQFGPKPDPSYGGGGRYSLFVADSSQIAALFSKPFEFVVNTDLSSAVLSLNQNVLKPGTTDSGESLPPQSPFGRQLTGSLDFTYGESFYLVSVLTGYANDFGVLNALNSAHFGINAPVGSTLSADSGFVYASAVPEPASWVLLVLAGPLLLLHRKQAAARAGA